MLGCRTFFEVERGREDVLNLVWQQQHSWLRRKGRDPDAIRFDRTTELASHVEAIALARTDRDGSRAVRSRIEEHNRNGTWTTQLTVLTPGSNAVVLVWLDILDPEADGTDGEQRFRRTQWTAVPWLACNALEVLSAHDGTARLDTRPRTERSRSTSRPSVLGRSCECRRRSRAPVIPAPLCGSTNTRTRGSGPVRHGPRCSRWRAAVVRRAREDAPVTSTDTSRTCRAGAGDTRPTGTLVTRATTSGAPRGSTARGGSPCPSR